MGTLPTPVTTLRLSADEATCVEACLARRPAVPGVSWGQSANWVSGWLSASQPSTTSASASALRTS
jgi:hypothetical protein